MQLTYKKMDGTQVIVSLIAKSGYAFGFIYIDTYLSIINTYIKFTIKYYQRIYYTGLV